jgi:hypothetical protein
MPCMFFSHLDALPLTCALAVSSLGCSVVAPPPLMPQLAGTAPNTPGEMRILLVMGVGAGVWLDGGVGGELRIESQVNEWATVGGGVAGALNLDREGDARAKETPGRSSHPRFLYAARTWGRFNPGTLDWIAITSGAGFVGTDLGTVALTFDASPRFGHPFRVGRGPGGEPFRLTPYGGPAAAVSIPVRQGQPIQKQRISLGWGPDMRTTSSYEPVPYSTTFFVGAQGGLAVDSPGTPAWTGALELTMLSAFSASDSAVLFAIAMGQGVRVR